MAKRRAFALTQDAARVEAAASALGALVGQTADLLAEAGKPLGEGGIADEMTPDQASRASNIHAFVKFDAFLMNLPPNSFRDRRNPYLFIGKFNECRRILRFDP